MFHFSTSDVFPKKKKANEGEQGKKRREEKKQVLDKSGSLHLVQTVPQDSKICVYHTHAAHTNDYCQKQCGHGLHF